MEMTDKTRSNIWLGFAIFSIICVISRAYHIAMGEKEWWHLVTTIAMTGFCIKFFLCYRRKAKSPSQKI